jgi:hypothetical protein
LVALGVAEKFAKALLTKLEKYRTSWWDRRNTLAATLAGTVGAGVLGGQALRRRGRRPRHETGPEAAPDYEEAHRQASFAIDDFYAAPKELRKGVKLEHLLANTWREYGQLSYRFFISFYTTHALLALRKDQKWYHRLNDGLLANLKANDGPLE